MKTLNWGEKKKQKPRATQKKNIKGQEGRKHISGKTFFPFSPLFSSLKGIPHVSGFILLKQVYMEGSGCGKNNTM